MKTQHITLAILAALAITLSAALTGCPAITGERPPLEVGQEYTISLIDGGFTGTLTQIGPGLWIKMEGRPGTTGGGIRWINLQFANQVIPQEP